MDAESREAVFAALRAQGIKAIKVVAADGSKANGEVRGVRKRVLVLSALCLVLSAALVVWAFVFGGRGAPGGRALPLNTAPRHQIYGDPVIVERFERGDFGDALTNRADRMLAWFAQPGKLMCPRGVDPRRMAGEFAEAYCPRSSFLTSGQETASTLTSGGDTLREVRELRQIVNGMREELREYLANGNGTPRSYWRRLLQRTQQEMQICERTRRELENERSAAVWEEKNEALRRLGLRPIPNPRDEE